MRDGVSSRWHLWLVFTFAALYFIFFVALDHHLLKSLYFKYSDLAYFEMSLRNLLNGHGLLVTNRGIPAHYFGEHAYIAHLILTLPVFFLFKSTLSIFAVGTFHVAAAGIVLYFFARRETGSSALALAAAALFYASPATQIHAGSLWPWGFHTEVFYLLYFLLMLHFWKTKPVFSVIAFFMALITKETFSISLFFTMAYLAWQTPGRRPLAFRLMGVSLVYFLVMDKFFMPYWGQGQAIYSYTTSLPELTAHLHQDFFAVLGIHWLHQLAHYYFLPLLSPWTMLLALPVSCINVLAKFAFGYTVPPNPTSWHSVEVHAFLAWSLVIGLRRLSQWGMFQNRRRTLVLIAGLVVFGDIWESQSLVIRTLRFVPDKALIADLEACRAQIPESEALSIDPNWGSLYLKQAALYAYPAGIERSSLVLVSPAAYGEMKLARAAHRIVLRTDRVVLIKIKR